MQQLPNFHVQLLAAGSKEQRYLDLAVHKELFHGFPVPLMQACMVHAYSKSQGQLQVGVSDSHYNVIHLEEEGELHVLNQALQEP